MPNIDNVPTVGAYTFYGQVYRYGDASPQDYTYESEATAAGQDHPAFELETWANAGVYTYGPHPGDTASATSGPNTSKWTDISLKVVN